MRYRRSLQVSYLPPEWLVSQALTEAHMPGRRGAREPNLPAMSYELGLLPVLAFFDPSPLMLHSGVNSKVKKKRHRPGSQRAEPVSQEETPHALQNEIKAEQRNVDDPTVGEAYLCRPRLRHCPSPVGDGQLLLTGATLRAHRGIDTQPGGHFRRIQRTPDKGLMPVEPAYSSGERFAALQQR